MNLWKYRLAQLVSKTQILPSSDNLQMRRVLMYHSVTQIDNKTTKTSDTYSLSEDYFRKHVNLLAQQNNSGQRLVVPLHSTNPGGVSITFDDGYKDTFTIAAQLLCQHDFAFHVFVTPTNILSGDDKYLTREDLIALSDMPGATIGAHGFSHQHLTALSSAEIEKELKSSKNWLEDVTSKTITTMSYPHGAFNPQIEEIAAAVGYLYAATSNWGTYNVGKKPLQIPRIDVWNLDNEKSLKQKLDGNWDWMQRFI